MHVCSGFRLSQKLRRRQRQRQLHITNRATGPKQTPRSRASDRTACICCFVSCGLVWSGLVSAAATIPATPSGTPIASPQRHHGALRWTLSCRRRRVSPDTHRPAGARDRESETSSSSSSSSPAAPDRAVLCDDRLRAPSCQAAGCHASRVASRPRSLFYIITAPEDGRPPGHHQPSCLECLW